MTPAPDLARIRHDLRTPLNHILGYCEILQEDTATPAAFQADLQRIHAGGRQMLALINELFDEELHATRKLDLFQLSHELRTPVNHIVGYGEMLQEEAEATGHERLLPDLKRITDAARAWLALMERHLIQAPATTGEPVPAPPKAAEAAPPATRPVLVPLQGRVLVVDDDEGNREILTRRLQREGLQVTAASGGAEALRVLASGTFDLVLLDMVMPGLDGGQVLARLKAYPATAAVPVIMISSLDQDDSVARCIESGAEDYIAKPFNPVFLRARIAACLEKRRLREQEARFLAQIQAEKEHSDELLHIILPHDVVAELKATGEVKPRRFEHVGVLFCDVVGFAAYSDRRPPEEILAHLQTLVQTFEQIAARHGLEKIKTIGDAFMAVAGLPTALDIPALQCVRAGLEMIAAAHAHAAGWQIRVGVNVGPVVAGIVGRMKYQFDVWGDTVNTAARVEQAGEPGAVCLPAKVWTSIAREFPGEPRGRVPLKGKGEVELVLVRPGAG
jgi:adenylate cyclase